MPFEGAGKSIREFKAKDLRFELLIRIVRLIYPEYRLTWPYLDWCFDPWFNSYLDRFNERLGMNTHRRWQLCQLMRLIETVPGDTAECGAFQGAGSFLICEMNSRNVTHTRRHHIFDSFDGLSAPSEKDGEHWSQGDLRSVLDELKVNLAQFHSFDTYPGWIPERFSDVSERRFAFVHVDVDLHDPTKDSIEFFYPRLNEGAILLCDDYGCTTCPGATDAIDSYLKDKPEKFVSLSAGGGFLIKGCSTGPKF